MPQRFNGSKELSISFHVITGHYHSMIIIAHSSIHEFKKIFVNFTFRVRHICLNLKLNILLKNCEIFCLLEYLMNQVFIQLAGKVQNRKEGEVSVLQPKFGGFFLV